MILFHRTFWKTHPHHASIDKPRSFALIRWILFFIFLIYLTVFASPSHPFKAAMRHTEGAGKSAREITANYEGENFPARFAIRWVLKIFTFKNSTMGNDWFIRGSRNFHGGKRQNLFITFAFWKTNGLCLFTLRTFFFQHISLNFWFCECINVREHFSCSLWKFTRSLSSSVTASSCQRSNYIRFWFALTRRGTSTLVAYGPRRSLCSTLFRFSMTKPSLASVYNQICTEP